MRHRVAAAGTLAIVVAAFGVGGFAVQAAQAPSAETRSSIDSRLNRLEAEVSAAEDLAAIKRLQRIYGYYLDKGMWEDLAAFFTDDAVANYPAGTFIGHDSIRQHLFMNVGGKKMGEIGLGDNRLYNHMNIQPVVHLDPGGQTAKGRWRAFATFGSLGGGATWAEGVYEMQYAKVKGVWKISRLDYYSGFGAPYATGWVAPQGAAGSSRCARRRGAHGALLLLARGASSRIRPIASGTWRAMAFRPRASRRSTTRIPARRPAARRGTHRRCSRRIKGRGDAARRAADLAHRASLLSDETERRKPPAHLRLLPRPRHVGSGRGPVRRRRHHRDGAAGRVRRQEARARIPRHCSDRHGLDRWLAERSHPAPAGRRRRRRRQHRPRPQPRARDDRPVSEARASGAKASTRTRS